MTPINTDRPNPHRTIIAIAFPAISTGAYGYPKRAATVIAVAAMLEYEQRFERIVACCFSDDDAALYRNVLQELRAIQ